MGYGTGDQDSRTRANGLLASMSKFQFIITQVTVMKCLSVDKPLSRHPVAEAGQRRIQGVNSGGFPVSHRGKALMQPLTSGINQLSS